LPVIGGLQDVSVCAGESVTLTATGSATFVWSDGIQNGVAFVPSATKTYTVTATNASGCQSTATVTVTVNELPVPVIAQDGLNLSTSQPFASYQWFRNGQAISGATARNFTVSQEGNYTVLVSNDSGCEATSAAVNIDAQLLSVTNRIDFNFTVYPNPAVNVLYISSKDYTVQIEKLELIDASGRLIQQMPYNGSQVDVQGLKQGVYLLRIHTEYGISTQRFIKK
jgi:hypothetical protein